MGIVTPQQRALIGLAQLQGQKPPTTPSGKSLRFEPLTDAEDQAQIEGIGANALTTEMRTGKPMANADRMSQWDSIATPETAAAPAPRKPVMPRVDIATASAVAADAARTGKSKEELYRERGYDTTGSAEGLFSNLRQRAGQGDAGAWQKLAWLAPGETPEALLTGTRREREGRALRFAKEQAQINAAKEEAANAAAQSARASELEAGRRQQITLAQMQIDAQTKAAQAQAEYNNKKLAIEEMAARGQIDAARAAQEMAKAQNERNNQLAQAQLELQREGMGLERLKFQITADQADPMKALKRTAIEASIAQAAEQGEDPMVKLGQIMAQDAGAQPAAKQDGTPIVPITKETMEAARQDMLKATDTRTVATVLAQYLPMLEGRPQMAAQLMAIAKARVPDIETRLGAIAKYAQHPSADAMNDLETSSMPLRWGAALGRRAATKLGLVPEGVTIAEARKYGNAWDRLSQPSKPK